MTLKRMIKLLLSYLKMSKINLELNEITKFRLDEINKVKEYFNLEIKERKDIVKKISKYIVFLTTLIRFSLGYPHRLEH